MQAARSGPRERHVHVRRKSYRGHERPLGYRLVGTNPGQDFKVHQLHGEPRGQIKSRHRHGHFVLGPAVFRSAAVCPDVVERAEHHEAAEEDLAVHADKRSRG